MLVAEPHALEAERLALLKDLNLLDTPAEPVFDAITRLAAQIAGVPIALISLVDGSRQWFKSRYGLAVAETSRDVSFCAHALHNHAPLAVEDATLDPRFHDNPLVTGHPGIRAYAGIPLRSIDGLPLGTLCVIDQKPRIFSEEEMAALMDLAELARRELLHHEVAMRVARLAESGRHALVESDAQFRAVFEQAAVGMATVGLDGNWRRVNGKLCDVLGRTPEELRGLTFQDITHPDDLALDLGHVQTLMEGRADRYAIEKRYLRPDGSLVWAHLSVSLVRRQGEPHYFVALVEDISARKRAETALQSLHNQLEERVAERTEELQMANSMFSRAMQQTASAHEALQDREADLRAVLENALDAYICINEGGVIVEWNRQAEVTFGWSRAEAVGRGLHDLIIPPGFKDPHLKGMDRLLRTGDGPVMGKRLELPALTKQGRTIPCEVTINALPTVKSGHLFFAFLHDITERKRVEQALAASEHRLRTVADNLPVLISYVDREGRFQFCNRTYDAWLGIDSTAAVGQKASDMFGEQAYAQRAPMFARALAGERVEFEIDTEHDGQRRHLHLLYLPDVAQDGVVVGFYALVSDVTASKNAQRQLTRLARTDTLTGLPNRRAFEETMDQALARRRRVGDAMALLFLDIDHFKQINDSRGHGIGDEVLKTFALRLSACVRETDTVARLAGDEFVVILEGLHAPHEAELVAQKIIQAMATPFALSDGLFLDVRASIGAAYDRSGRLSTDELMAEADHALYSAKSAGRNTYGFVHAKGTAN